MNNEPKSVPIERSIMKALIELRKGELTPSMDSRDVPFPGAIGRIGTKLVRMGLAKRVGLIPYEKYLRYVCFELTEEGRAIVDAYRTGGSK